MRALVPCKNWRGTALYLSFYFRFSLLLLPFPLSRLPAGAHRDHRDLRRSAQGAYIKLTSRLDCFFIRVILAYPKSAPIEVGPY
jgi:hypothetical protein